MKRRSFIGLLSAAFATPKLPALPAEEPTKRLLLIADEMNQIAAFRPVNYVGAYRWKNFDHLIDEQPRRFTLKLAEDENTIPETGRIETEAD